MRLFAADAASGALLSVQKGDYSLSLTPVSAADPNQPSLMSISEEVSAEILTAVGVVEDVVADDFYTQAQPEKIYSALEYANILDGATLRYENYANSIVRARQKQPIWAQLKSPI